MKLIKRPHTNYTGAPSAINNGINGNTD